MWLCDYCNAVNSKYDGHEVVCMQCSFTNVFLTRWSRARILVLGANYGQNDNSFWSALDNNYIGIGKEACPADSFITIFQNDWNACNFWEQSVIPKTFDSIFIDASVPFIFAIDMNLFKNVFDFIQRHSRPGSKLYFENHNFCTLISSYMARVFLDNLNPLHNYPIHACNTYIKNDISLMQTILHSGDWVIYDTDLDVQNTDQKHKCTWKALYKVHSQIKNS